MGISYIKTLVMGVSFFRTSDGENRKVKAKELSLEYAGYSSRFQDTLKINLPDSDESLLVDAVWLKEACEKCIALRTL